MVRLDCQNCRQRRIICDRTRPKCVKCSTRSLECPGYSVKFRWKPPKLGPAPFPTAGTSSHPDPGHSTNFSTSSSLLNDRILSSLYQPIRTPSSTLPANKFHYERLLGHYVDVIAPQLDWVDAPMNVFRCIVPAMSLEFPTVNCALLALAAGDLAALHALNKTQSHHNYLIIQDSLQNEALVHLSSGISRMTQEPGRFGSLRQDELRAMLVSMFLLVSLGIRTGCGPVWRLHVRAARALSNAWLALDHFRLQVHSCIERAIVVLLLEFQVWSSLTDIDPPPEWIARLSPGIIDGPFHRYVGILHQITAMAREKRATTSHEMERIQKDIDHATRITKGHAQQIGFGSDLARQSFYSMIEIFHQAALIYLYRMCTDHETDDRILDLPRTRLFEALRALPDMGPIAHCLPWPLLIAGTECQGRIEDQKFVESRLLEVIQRTGTLDRTRMLGLLQEIWADGQQKTVVDWIDMAQRRNREDPVLIQ